MKKTFALLLLCSSASAFADQREIPTTNGETLKVEAKDCSSVEYSEISLISKNSIQTNCAPVLCKVKVVGFVFSKATDVEISRFNGESNILLESTNNKRDTMSAVSRLVSEGKCKDFQFQNYTVGKWPKNLIW